MAEINASIVHTQCIENATAFNRLQEFNFKQMQNCIKTALLGYWKFYSCSGYSIFYWKSTISRNKQSSCKKELSKQTVIAKFPVSFNQHLKALYQTKHCIPSPKEENIIYSTKNFGWCSTVQYSTVLVQWKEEGKEASDLIGELLFFCSNIVSLIRVPGWCSLQ